MFSGMNAWNVLVWVSELRTLTFCSYHHRDKDDKLKKEVKEHPTQPLL